MTEAAGAAGAGAGGEDLKGGAGAAGAAGGAAAGAGAGAGAGGAGAGGAGAGGAAGAGAGETALGGTGAAGGAGEGAAGAGAGAGDAPTWPADWRERKAKAIAGKGEGVEYDKILGKLKRFASPENVARWGFEADAKIRSGQFKRTLEEGATPEEIATYRKENGIPDKPEGYELAMPEGVAATDADKAVLSHFSGVMHQLHIPGAQAKTLTAALHEHTAKVAGELRALARDTTINNRATLKSAWGADYDLNRRLGDDLMIKTLGEEDAPKLGALVLSDGTRLGDHPMFANFVVQAARSTADDETLVAAELLGGGAGGSLDDQYKAAVDLRFSNPRKYASKEHQDKLFKLAGARSKKTAA